ncbi:MAG: hypothetical protein DRO11_07425 [Methanobacteriota archaeon]|nr:MAG: hypothetical protein DRO11_07425 [Euryarchaeota archaeon]
MTFKDWITDKREPGGDEINIGSMPFCVVLLIGILILIFVLCSTPAQGGSLSKDAAGTWRINTFPQEQRNIPHMMMGRVYRPIKGVIYVNTYGPVDSWECGNDLPARKIEARDISVSILAKILRTIGSEDYVVSMAISVCHPEWFVIYLHTGEHYASKEVYIKVMKALQ